MWQKITAKCGSYYKVWQEVITKWDNYYKVRCSSINMRFDFFLLLSVYDICIFYLLHSVPQVAFEEKVWLKGIVCNLFTI